jgi:hypothetical protein
MPDIAMPVSAAAEEGGDRRLLAAGDEGVGQVAGLDGRLDVQAGTQGVGVADVATVGRLDDDLQHRLRVAEGVVDGVERGGQLVLDRDAVVLDGLPGEEPEERRSASRRPGAR